MPSVSNKISVKHLQKPKSQNTDTVFPLRNEILSIIFSFLHLNELLNVSTACKTFFSLSHPSLENFCQKKIIKTFDESVLGMLENIQVIEKLNKKELTWQELWHKLNDPKFKENLEKDENFRSYATSYIYRRLDEDVNEKECIYVKDEEDSFEVLGDDKEEESPEHLMGEENPSWLKKKLKLF